MHRPEAPASTKQAFLQASASLSSGNAPMSLHNLPGLLVKEIQSNEFLQHGGMVEKVSFVQ